MPSGGIMQLLSVGYQDLYLSDSPQTKKARVPYVCPSLENMCVGKLTEKQKTLVCSMKDSYPILFDKITETEKYLKATIVRSLSNFFEGSKNPDKKVTHLLFGGGALRYCFDSETKRKTMIRRMKYKKQIGSNYTQRLKELQFSQQNSIRHDRAMKQIQFERIEEENFGFDLFD